MQPALWRNVCPLATLNVATGRKSGSRSLSPRTMKAGFCNSLCTRSGCLDLAQKKSVEQTLGDASGPGRWLFTPYGAFAAAFPGFIVGYYTSPDVALSAALSVYGHVGLWMPGSWLAVAILALAFRVAGPVATVPIAGLSFGLYYWFAAPVVTDAFAPADWAPAAIRVAALGLLGMWVYRAYDMGRLWGRGPIF